MAELTFHDLSFEDQKDKIRINFLRLFYFDLDKKDLNKISDFIVDKNKITFKDIKEIKASKKFNFLLSEGFKTLKNRLNGKKTIYIHKNSGIPLIGNGAFGIVDRGTSLIELKPITSCNLECVYCSVDESKRAIDFVVEKDYLVDELKKLVKFKGIYSIEVHIGTQGEPLLYAPLVELIKDISSIKQVKTISMDTNGVMLSNKKIDEIVKAGLTRFNFSINAMDPKKAEKIAGSHYNINAIRKTAGYIAKKSSIMITPVMIPGMNEEEMPKIIEFAIEIKAELGIQNFLPYRFGRNPAKPMNFGVFYEKLKEWEKRYGVRLIKTEEDFDIKETKGLPKPFKKGEIVKARIVCPDRLPNASIAVSRERTISIPNCHKEGEVKLKITRTKHNIFLAQLI